MVHKKYDKNYYDYYYYQKDLDEKRYPVYYMSNYDYENSDTDRDNDLLEPRDPLSPPPIHERPLDEPNQRLMNQRPIGQQPPMGSPQIDQPPIGRPQVGQPQVDQPPVGQPPFAQPPVDEPIILQPPVNGVPGVQPGVQPPVNGVPGVQPGVQPPVNGVPGVQPGVQPPVNGVPGVQPGVQPPVNGVPGVQPGVQPPVNGVPGVQPGVQPPVNGRPGVFPPIDLTPPDPRQIDQPPINIAPEMRPGYPTPIRPIYNHMEDEFFYREDDYYMMDDERFDNPMNQPPMITPNMEMRQYRTLDEALDLMREAILLERDKELLYNFLLRESPDEAQRDLILDIRNDEIKHIEMFKSIYSEFTGETIEVPEVLDFVEPLTFLEGIQIALLDELESLEQYRDIRAGLDDRYHRDILFEIITDELEHADKLNYLIILNR
ncbi:rubrerythrin [Natranaerovirga pectinivora]|uniref:Rubrerythrin n=1 Tax=Natranaerovirga pectinivora TaxID=682400 RepID=A0A4R3MQU6_9FIRM|nr:ferritin-like domain-containing protein [Natranaerovirga pectinivora]TCT16286.1 rubrerythrin [Natranaerovirga pectinivora]